MTTIAHLQSAQQALPPGTESWGEKYGVIGVVAALALAALGIALAVFFRERKDDRLKAAKDDEQHDKLVADLNAKIVEIVREGSSEVTKHLVTATAAHEQRLMTTIASHEQRYNLLLQRYVDDMARAHDAIRVSNANNQETLAALARKLRG